MHGWKWLVPENDWKEYRKPAGTIEVKGERHMPKKSAEEILAMRYHNYVSNTRTWGNGVERIMTMEEFIADQKRIDAMRFDESPDDIVIRLYNTYCEANGHSMTFDEFKVRIIAGLHGLL
jgi:hypothetical protein